MGTAALIFAAASMISAATLAAAQSGTSAVALPTCGSASLGARMRAVVAAQPAPAARVRVGERQGTRGQYVGRQLELTPGRGGTVLVELPAESSVAPARGNVVVYTRVVGGRSEVRALDLIEGCDTLLARPAGVVRSASLSPGGDALYVHSVTAAGRADAGVTRYSLDGASPVVVVPPLPADDRYGRTFGTLLAWSADETTLAVQSCAMETCRTRLLDVASGRIEMLDQVPHGTLIGVTPTHVVAFEACHWQPCAVIGIERTTGTRRILAEEAWEATLALDDDGTAIVSITTAAGILEVAP